ncbi:hypothetical protein JZ751_005840 [Albula glossodonta]|uniref:Glucoside xylosyltransferase 1 n=1 Tax=Albula glossodonta TaxID=121402 RepID=A0A8T2P0J8_9TELE|nr:hypothetical protein JZ751_005840 [Albula glossodonta]
MRRYLRVLLYYTCSVNSPRRWKRQAERLGATLDREPLFSRETRDIEPGKEREMKARRINTGIIVTYWNPYWRLPPGVCGMNCYMDSAFRYIMRRPDSSEGVPVREERVHLAVVACGQRLEETLTMLKSALEAWPDPFRSRLNYTVYPITFPPENAKEWKKLFKPCASQRLFLPIILKEVDSLLYVDTDILFLRPVEDVWAFLSHFNSTQMAAMAPEHEDPRIAWYSRFARHPYHGKTGINSGVMLMNMTRIRSKLFKNDMTSVELSWEDLLMPLLQKYKLNITWGDQDLLNIIFHHNPESLFVFPCQWNYRPDHCIYGSNCLQAEQDGVFILHGNRGVYHDEKQPAFRAVYEAIQKYPFGADPLHFLLLPLEAQLQQSTHTYCGRVRHLFTKTLQRSASRDPASGR